MNYQIYEHNTDRNKKWTKYKHKCDYVRYMCILDILYKYKHWRDWDRNIFIQLASLPLTSTLEVIVTNTKNHKYKKKYKKEIPRRNTKKRNTKKEIQKRNKNIK